MAWIPLQFYKDFEANITNAMLNALENELVNLGMYNSSHVHHGLRYP